MAIASIAVACTLTTDVSSLDNGVCPSGDKGCPGPGGAYRCFALNDPSVGCGAAMNCVPCFVQNGSATCDTRETPSACAIGGCNGGYEDCDGLYDDGCEVDVTIDPSSCGSCSNVCAPVKNGTPGCTGGACVIGACDTGWADCDSNSKNGCETPCAPQQVCAQADGEAGTSDSDSGTEDSGSGTMWVCRNLPAADGGHP